MDRHTLAFAQQIEQELAIARHDIEAYRGALGYAIPGDHNGKLMDGTIPQCGICNSQYTLKAKAFYESRFNYECPWPESVWPMTDEQYVKAIPDGAKRTAIAGFLMRLGWNEAMRQINKTD